MQIRHALGLLAMLVTVALAEPAGAVTAYQTPLKPAVIPDDVKPLTITSTTFANGGTLPVANVTCGPGQTQGQSISPQLSWTPGPAGTESYVVTMFDTDAPTGLGFWQWVVFNIPANVTSLALDASKQGMPAGAVQASNDDGNPEYRGPCPPVGGAPHHYWITVSAMNVTFKNFPPHMGGTRLAFMMGFAGKILARGQYLGRYGR